MDKRYLVRASDGEALEGTASEIVTELRRRDWHFQDLPDGEASDREYREAVASRVQMQSSGYVATAGADGFLMSLALAGVLTVKDL